DAPTRSPPVGWAPLTVSLDHYDRHRRALRQLAAAAPDDRLGADRARPLEHRADGVLVRADGVDDLAARGDAALAQLGEAVGQQRGRVGAAVDVDGVGAGDVGLVHVQ